MPSSKVVNKIKLDGKQGLPCEACGALRGLLFPVKILGKGEVLIYCRECLDKYKMPMRRIKDGEEKTKDI